MAMRSFQDRTQGGSFECLKACFESLIGIFMLLILRLFKLLGCPPGIRTPIDRFRADCSTIELGGKVLSVVRCRVANRMFADCLI
jgi:hypothetical protein